MREKGEDGKVEEKMKELLKKHSQWEEDGEGETHMERLWMGEEGETVEQWKEAAVLIAVCSLGTEGRLVPSVPIYVVWVLANSPVQHGNA